MERRGRLFTCAAAALAAVLALSVVTLPHAGAQAPTLAGKTVHVIVGFGPGGGYDLWGRTLARHIGRHLPGNPTVVPQNMPGAGSYAAMNYIYTAAPKDGTAIALVARDAGLGPIMKSPGARFDATRFSWIGTPTKETNVCIANSATGIRTVGDLVQKQLTVGDTGPANGTHTYPTALNVLLGMKFKVVGGYPSSAEVFMAMERREVDGICESLDSINVRRPDWISSGTVAVLFQGGTEPDPDLKGIPFVLDLARTAEERQAIEFLYAGQGFGRPFVAPPDLPPDRLKMLREAFDATMQDPEFIAETKLRGLDLKPDTGEHLAALIRKAYATPQPIVERVGQLIK